MRYTRKAKQGAAREDRVDTRHILLTCETYHLILRVMLLSLEVRFHTQIVSSLNFVDA